MYSRIAGESVSKRCGHSPSVNASVLIAFIIAARARSFIDATGKKSFKE